MGMGAAFPLVVLVCRYGRICKAVTVVWLRRVLGMGAWAPGRRV